MKSVIIWQLRLSMIFLFFAISHDAFAAERKTVQQLKREQVKIAYIYNFFKHIDWPNSSQKTQYTLAVYDDNDFYLRLKKSLQNRQVKKTPIIVVAINNINVARQADLLYIPTHQNKNLAQLANALRGSHTLLVTDNSSDKHNAMINLTDNNEAISFEVNKSNIVYEQLTVSAELLLLGGTELDVATLYRETELAMQATRDRELALAKKLDQQQLLLRDSSALLAQLNANLKRSSEEIRMQRIALKKLKDNEAIQAKALLEKEHKLASILPKLAQAEQNFIDQTAALLEQKQAMKEMAQRITEKKKILEQQKLNIDKQSAQLHKQVVELADSKTTINNQKTTILITLIMIAVTGGVALLIVVLFIKNKKTTHKLTETLNHLKETQQQLIQSEKMASLGSLIAGVAHEINTPLGIAVTSTSLIKDKTEEIAEKLATKTLKQSQLKAFVDVAIKSVDISNKGLERVIVLLNNFKQVAADQTIERVREINVADYIDEVITTLGSELKKHHVEFSFSGDETIKISTIPGALAQVISNLVTNSIRHGFEDKDSGNISITLDLHSADEIIIIYKDDGIGMKEEVLAQVFEPFFTTKRNKGGTGLGMNIVFNIIEQKLMGKITIDSRYQQGVTCCLILPKLLPEKPIH